MKNLLFSIFSLTIILLAACSGAGSDPKVAAKAFYEALGKKDYDKAAQYATKDSKTLLDLIKSMSEMGGGMNFETDMNEEEQIKKAVYTTAEIDGDKAVVKVSTGSEEHNIKLIKEDGVWKVALDKETLKETAAEESGRDINEINSSMDEALRQIESMPLDSIKQAMDKAAEILKNDSLRKTMDKAGEIMKKAGEAMQEASKGGNNQ